MKIKLISRLKFNIDLSIKLRSNFDKELKTHENIQNVMVLINGVCICMLVSLVDETFLTEAIDF